MEFMLTSIYYRNIIIIISIRVYNFQLYILEFYIFKVEKSINIKQQAGKFNNLRRCFSETPNSKKLQNNKELVWIAFCIDNRCCYSSLTAFNFIATLRKKKYTASI